MRTFLRLIVVVLAALLLPAAVGGVNGVSAARGQYAPPEGAAAPAAVAPLRPHDPDKPTAVVVVGGRGGEASDVLAPFEVLAVTDAFNVYTVAPERRPLPLTGGLHLVPDLSFGELGQRLTSRHGLVFVPTSDLHGVGDDLDRLVVPGAGAARRRDPDLAAHAIGEHGLTAEYVHAEPGFPFEPALRDLAATVDLPTAKWTATLLEYPRRRPAADRAGVAMAHRDDSAAARPARRPGRHRRVHPHPRRPPRPAGDAHVRR